MLALPKDTYCCGPQSEMFRSAWNTLLCKFAIHCRPLAVTLR